MLAAMGDDEPTAQPQPQSQPRARRLERSDSSSDVGGAPGGRPTAAAVSIAGAATAVASATAGEADSDDEGDAKKPLAGAETKATTAVAASVSPPARAPPQDDEREAAGASLADLLDAIDTDAPRDVAPARPRAARATSPARAAAAGAAGAPRLAVRAATPDDELGILDSDDSAHALASVADPRARVAAAPARGAGASAGGAGAGGDGDLLALAADDDLDAIIAELGSEDEPRLEHFVAPSPGRTGESFLVSPYVEALSRSAHEPPPPDSPPQQRAPPMPAAVADGSPSRRVQSMPASSLAGKGRAAAPTGGAEPMSLAELRTPRRPEAGSGLSDDEPALSPFHLADEPSIDASASSLRESASRLRLGDRVAVHGCAGTIRFIGYTHRPGLWVGVELDLPEGFCDGSLRGVSYFACEPRHGKFVKPSSLSAL